jgi:hypothetical protein
MRASQVILTSSLSVLTIIVKQKQTNKRLVLIQQQRRSRRWKAAHQARGLVYILKRQRSQQLGHPLRLHLVPIVRLPGTTHHLVQWLTSTTLYTALSQRTYHIVTLSIGDNIAIQHGPLEQV